MGYSRRLTPHGFRATAATVLSEMGFRSELIEKQLAHAERRKEKAAYLRSPHLEEVRVMLQIWADTIDAMRQAAAAPATKVVPIGRKKAS